MKAFCEFFSLVVWKQTTPDTVVMARLRCKSWQCPYCARKNREMWRKHLQKMLPRISSNWWFITLTAHENLRGAEASLANIRSNLDRLFKRANRVWSKIEYVRTYETHKKGAFHAHLICAGLSARVQKFTARNGVEYYRPSVLERGKGNLSCRTWWRKTARSIGMGYMVDVQALEGIPDAVRYVTKYLTKDAQNFVARSLRRVQTSRKIGSPRNSGDGTWTTSARVFRQDVPEGARLYDADRRLFVPQLHWETHLTYPIPNDPA